MLKKFHRIAVLKGEASNNPFANFRLGREETIKNWLTEDELQKLHNLLETGDITEAVKNTLRHFLFSCYTGIRFGDKKKMTDQHVVNDRLSMQTNKTKKISLFLLMVKRKAC
jgi:integrase/recombinase XerD